ncbi:uncharacterized protein CELE_Y73B3A.11 [Caenorhabditis elegans]|uniref:Uncharacterized protein n=1 Tax=Caenorhabditis elegans TaxID=6239 RepID=Q95XF8_CAEEL|nr:Uncharacterized protein CELE_Y73B3A.11 [Caenorhabditis elegans]CCD74434.2 Uncharacterized protein CELE_Y73B3A.11 [Caenorhabditis elegans]
MNTSIPGLSIVPKYATVLPISSQNDLRDPKAVIRDVTAAQKRKNLAKKKNQFSLQEKASTIDKISKCCARLLTKRTNFYFIWRQFDENWIPWSTEQCSFSSEPDANHTNLLNKPANH